MVLAPLEDGDRCEALIAMGKKVITIDLNPLSRTSRYATVSIVDDIERALRNLISVIESKKEQQQRQHGNSFNLDALLRAYDYDNKANLKAAIKEIATRLIGNE